MNHSFKLTTLTIMFTIVSILMGCTMKSGIDRTIEQNKALLHHCFDEINKGNVDCLDRYFAEDCIYHGPAGNHNANYFKIMRSTFFSAFPDAISRIEDIIAARDKVVTYWRIRGTHQGDLQGIAPTGKKVTITGIMITRVKNGKIVEEWEAFNQLNLMEQLGVIPISQNTNQQIALK
jgi:steroid delta-isomerase-like uncharacterized protein